MGMSEAQYVLLHTSPLEVQTSKFDSLLSLSAFFHKNHKSALLFRHSFPQNTLLHWQ